LDTRFYLAVISPADSGYEVVFPDFPGAVTVADTVEEAQRNAIEALCLHVEGMLEDGEALPEPSGTNVELPDWVADEDLSRAIRILVPIEVDSKIVRVNVTMESGLLARLDRVASARGVSRSAALAEAARGWMKAG
jgi:predicted RNase H-like HicB family nuclease